MKNLSARISREPIRARKGTKKLRPLRRIKVRFKTEQGKLQILMKYLEFKKQINKIPVLNTMKIKLSGDSSTSAIEPFSHYDAFYFWIANDLANLQKKKFWI